MRSEQGNFTPSTTQRVGLTWALAAVRNSFAAAVSSVPRQVVHAAPDEVRDGLQRDGLLLARRAADAVVDVDGQQSDGSFDNRARSSAGLHRLPVLWVCAQERVSLAPAVRSEGGLSSARTLSCLAQGGDSLTQNALLVAGEECRRRRLVGRVCKLLAAALAELGDGAVRDHGHGRRLRRQTVTPHCVKAGRG